MGFPRQEYWSGFPFPSPGDLPHPEVECRSLISPASVIRFFTKWATGEAPGAWKPQGWKGHTWLQSRLIWWHESPLGNGTPARDDGEWDLPGWIQEKEKGLCWGLSQSLPHSGTRIKETIRNNKGQLGTDPKELLTFIFICFLFLCGQGESQNLGKD